MQLITFASAAAALVATVSATGAVSAFNLNSSCILTEPKVRIVNRCPYDVHLWSVLKGQGCPSDDGAVLGTGEVYYENFRPAVNGAGTSIKVSKTSQCKGVDVVQLEYYPEITNPQYAFMFLDVSYVDCTTNNCPTKAEGYYLQSGNQDGLYKANTANEICPILSCDGPESCAKCSYILPDDVQTKSCDLKADLDFYMCGGEAPGDEPSTPPAAPSEVESSSAQVQPSSTPTPTPSSHSKKIPAYTPEVEAAAVTPAPEPAQPKPINVKTEVVYVTEYAYVNAKRHSHGHRHPHIRA